VADVRIPPHSEEAEQSVLGAVLIDKDAIVSVAEFLRAEHFYQKNHGLIYEAALSLFEKREPIDLVTLTEELKKGGNLDKVGGASYLADLVNVVPTAAHVEQYGRIVKDHATRRNLITAASRVTELAFSEGSEIAELLDQAEQTMFGVSQEHLRQFFTPLKDALAQSFDRLDEINKQPEGLRGVPTGLRDLDNLLAGLQESNLIILASRPSVGKTSLALGIARYASVMHNIPVGIFSIEMSQEELVDRLLVAQSGVDAWNLKTGKLKEEDFAKLTEAMGLLAEAPLYIDDTPGISVLEMRTKARRLQAEKELQLLIVDYLQLVRGRGLENRVQEVSDISQSLKMLARELKIPVLALSQLSRAVEARGAARPRLADLRESGALEQDADVVMFLYREDDDDHENVTLEVAKHRNGPLGRVSLKFIGKLISFFALEKKRKAKKEKND
jgi:replicative DNA helicase